MERAKRSLSMGRGPGCRVLSWPKEIFRSGSMKRKGSDADSSTKMENIRGTHVSGHKSKKWKIKGRVGGQELGQSTSSPERGHPMGE